MTGRKKAETYGSVNNEKVRISYRDVFMRSIMDFGNCRFKMTCEKLYSKRSTITYNEDGTVKGKGQNGYYHFIVLEELAKALSNVSGTYVTKKEAHEFCCAKFWGIEHVLETGEILTIPGHSSDKSTVDFEERLQRIKDFSLDYLKHRIPDVNEQSEVEFPGIPSAPKQKGKKK